MEKRLLCADKEGKEYEMGGKIGKIHQETQAEEEVARDYNTFHKNYQNNSTTLNANVKGL